jgi:2-iminobutanoate/2-iminopropanoate deaminase
MKRIIVAQDAPAPIGPYSQAVMAGNTLFISGQIAIDPVSQTYVPADVESEAVLVMKNLHAILKAAEMDFSHVVKSSIFLADMNDFAKVNAIYASYFRDQFPARETVQVSVLPKNCKVEISMIAYKP